MIRYSVHENTIELFGTYLDGEKRDCETMGSWAPLLSSFQWAGWRQVLLDCQCRDCRSSHFQWRAFCIWSCIDPHGLDDLPVDFEMQGLWWYSQWLFASFPTGPKPIEGLRKQERPKWRWRSYQLRSHKSVAAPSECGRSIGFQEVSKRLHEDWEDIRIKGCFRQYANQKVKWVVNWFKIAQDVLHCL